MEILEKLSDDYVSQLATLYRNVWFTQGREIPDIKRMLEKSYLTLAFVKDDRLIGFCRAISDGVYKAFLFDVIVEADYKNQGIGRYIIETAMEHKKLRDVKHIELYCPEEISPFYKKMGFETRSSLLLRYTR